MLAVDLEYFFIRVLNKISPYQNDIIELGIYFRGRREPIYTKNDLIYEHSKIPVDLTQPLEVNNENIVNSKYEVICSSGQISSGMMGTRPFLPILPAKLLEYYIDAYQASNNPYKDLLFKDPLGYTDDTKILTIDKSITYPEDVLYEALQIPDDLMSDITNLYNGILNKYFTPFMEEMPECVYHCDFSTSIATLRRGLDIRSLRYDMAIDEIHVRKRVEEEV
jgi:hypothetical protein